jgi:hypothetical protein
VGRQICLSRLTQDDRDRLLAYAALTGNGAYFVPSRFPVSTPPLLPSRDDQFTGSLVRRADVSKLVVDDVPSQGYWFVDTLRSPAVEWSTDRLWFSTGYWDSSEQWVTPDEEWLRWADGLFRWCRSHLTRNSTTGCYEGSAVAVERGLA